MNLMKRVFLTAIATGVVASASFADSYVVTSSGNKQTLTLDQVKEIYNLGKTAWPDGKAVVYSLPDTGSPEGTVFIDKVYGMSKEKVKKFWLEKTFRGEVAGIPETKSGAAVKEFLGSNPNGIGIVAGSAAEGLTKVLKLD